MKKLFYHLAVLAGICFVYLALNFKEPAWVAFDEWGRALLKDNVFIIFFHYFGEPVVAMTIGVTLLLFFAVRRKDYRAMLFVVLVFAGGNGLNQLLKHLVQRPRPDLVDQLTTYSFPSGHTMAGFFTVMTLAYFFSRGTSGLKKRMAIWLIAIFVGLLIGFSRIAEGRHFATDVLAGWCISYAWFVACIWWYERRNSVFEKGQN